jgi:hypothetical protein
MIDFTGIMSTEALATDLKDYRSLLKENVYFFMREIYAP